MPISVNPANTVRWPNVILMLGQRRRRWPNIEITFGQRTLFAGKCQPDIGYYLIRESQL